MKLIKNRPAAPKPGDTLENGADVIRVRQLRRTDGARTWIVLCSWMQGTRLEYISWKITHFTEEGPSSMACYAGRYSRDYNKALTHFQARK